MDEIRCPMCSELNPSDAETCRACGARLKPLVAGAPPPDAPENGDEPVPDWLSRIRSQPDDDEDGEPSEPEPEGEAEDWLGRLREPEPDAETESESESQEPPDWLGRLDAGQSEEEPAPEEDEGLPDWLADQEPDAPAEGPEAEEVPDWLARLRESEGAEPAEEPAEAEPEEGPAFEPPAEPEPEGLGWLEPEPGSQPEPEGLGWLEPGTEPEPGPAGADVPDWLGGMRAADSGEGEGPPEGEIPDWLAEFDEEPEPDEGDEQVPEWLARIRARESDVPEESEPIEESAEERLEEFEPEADSFPWEAAEEPAEVEAEEAFEPAGEERPRWLDEVEGDAEPVEPEGEELPHVPALIMDDDARSSEPLLESIDFDAIEIPDWLTDVRGAPAAPDTPREDRPPDLAPATLPSWLEAMRPVETFSPLIDLEPEIEETVETVGPLAGLRGVLSAEPVVAKPRAASVGGARLDVTERQFAQVEILRRIVEEEEREVSMPGAARRPLPILRWVITALLLLGVLIPSLTGQPSFPLPTRVPRDLGPLITLVNNVPAERPVLLVFDYEPGFSGELDAVAGALIQQVLTRDLRIVTISTRPTGPPLADRLVRQIGAPFSVENGRNYLHLGFLSGGPTAVQLFAAAPREAVLDGFRLPPDNGSTSAWDAPILAGIQRLSDFGMVAVITTGTDNARVWAEQAHPFVGETPLVMVLSAGAEPLVRPYFEALDPQVNGILAGLPAAVAYEQVNTRPGAAQAMWNSYGSGLLAAELALAAGVVYGLVSWVLRRREPEE